VKCSTTCAVASVSERRDDKSAVVPEILISIPKVTVGDAHENILHARLLWILLNEIS
jgi:hypothetical protein